MVVWGRKEARHDVSSSKPAAHWRASTEAAAVRLDACEGADSIWQACATGMQHKHFGETSGTHGGFVGSQGVSILGGLGKAVLAEDRLQTPDAAAEGHAINSQDATHA